MMIQVTCNVCNRVSMGVTWEYAINEVAVFNKYFDTISDEKRDEYYGNHRSHLSKYEKCACGNSYKNFRDSIPGDCPYGCTISPVIYFDDQT